MNHREISCELPGIFIADLYEYSVPMTDSILVATPSAGLLAWSCPFYRN